MSEERDFLTPAEAAQILRVSPQTVSRWAREGRIGFHLTLGGHRRFSRAEVMALARGGDSANGLASVLVDLRD